MVKTEQVIHSPLRLLFIEVENTIHFQPYLYLDETLASKNDRGAHFSHGMFTVVITINKYRETA